MPKTDPVAIMAAVLVLLTALAIADMRLAERRTIVVYTTPALRDLMEKDIVPRFEAATEHEVALVYVPAGQQYNRLRMGGDRPEADLFLHASPLYLEKAYATGHADPFFLADDGDVPERFKGRLVDGGRVWYTFAWSPLVTVSGRGIDPAPDLATTDASFGFPHPLLSNNGIYAVRFLEALDPAVGENILGNTRVQPVNARSNINGVADGSFALTLGYEAVVRFFQDQGAKVSYDIPLVAGERVTTAVIFDVTLIQGARHPGADDLARFLFTDGTQEALGRFHFRGVRSNETAPGLVDLGTLEHRMVELDWSDRESIEALLGDYEVKD